MTANQTIDGVPRELIVEAERIATGYGFPHTGRQLREILESQRTRVEPRVIAIVGSDHTAKLVCENWRSIPAGTQLADVNQVARELRALMDEPAAPVAPCAIADALESAQWTNTSIGNKVLVAAAITELRKAAQPQGEPVAIVVEEIHNYGDFLVFGSTIPGVQRPKPVVELKAHLLDRTLPNGTKLYAEQPAPVAVVMSFDFEHPSSKERHTVALSKQDVFDGMEDYFYDKLGEQICRCEPVGETNVVDCSCDEYVHDFEIVKACLDELKLLSPSL